MEKGLGLVSVKIRNIGKIKDIAVSLEPGVNVFQGDNGAGKSTVLEAVKLAISKGKGSIPADLIRHGLDENGKAFRGEIVVNTTAFQAAMDLYKGKGDEQKHRLSVSRDKGSTVNSPSSFLEQIANEWNDPQKIANMKGKNFYDILVKYAGVDLSTYDREIAGIKDDQSYNRRQLKELGTKTPVPNVKAVSVEDILAKIKEITEHNQLQLQRESIIKGYISEMNSNSDKIEKLQKEIDELKESNTKILSLRANADDPEPLKDIAPVKEKLNKLQDINKQAGEYKDFLTWKNKVAVITESFDKNKQLIAEKEKEKKEAVLNASMPVDGLSIAEDKTVTFNGNNWELCCESDKLLTGAKLIVNTTPENAIRWMMIHSGEGILSTRRKLLHDYLVVNGYTCLMQVASEQPPIDAPGYFYIVEGEIK